MTKTRGMVFYDLISGRQCIRKTCHLSSCQYYEVWGRSQHCRVNRIFCLPFLLFFTEAAFLHGPCIKCSYFLPSVLRSRETTFISHFVPPSVHTFDDCIVGVFLPSLCLSTLIT